MSAPTVAIATLGGRLTQVDSQEIAARLEQRDRTTGALVGLTGTMGK